MKFPVFILFFIGAFSTVSIFPQLQGDLQIFGTIGKKLLVAVLFLVGLNFSLTSLKEVGSKPIRILGLIFMDCGNYFLSFYYKKLSKLFLILKERNK